MPSFPLGRVRPNVSQPLADARLRVTRHTEARYHMPEYPSREAWQRRAEEIREHILVCAGLWPAPERPLIDARIFDRVEREGYAVEKVAFESSPGLLVTGNLYRPLGRPGPFPAVLNPHGHWKEGRLSHAEVGSVPARCISFARQGYVAFSPDMLGYLDSFQLDHRFDDPRAELWGITPLGLQLWNNLRAIDFLCALPDVDSSRVGCTGASGGGTQTFLLAAVDDRIGVAAPVNMISAHYQGGCRCENAPGLRWDTFNVEIAATLAPRPLLLVSATGDWTRDTPAVEYPAVCAIYRLFDAEERVSSVQIDAGHNYNQASREAVYAWFGRWLLGRSPDDPALREQPLSVEPEERLRVFAAGSRPAGLPTGSVLIDQLVAQHQAQIESLVPSDPARLDRRRAELETVFRHVLGAALPAPEELTVDPIGTERWGGGEVERFILGRKDVGDRLPALLFRPRDDSGASVTTLVAHERGKAALLDLASGEPGTLVRALLENGAPVLAVDLFLQGEHLSAYAQIGRALIEPHASTFNPPDVALRVQDLLTALAYLATRWPRADLVGIGDAGRWCLLARAIAPDAVRRLVADLAGFDVDDDQAYLDRLDVPNLRRVGDLRAAVALGAPRPTLLHNTAGRFLPTSGGELYRRLGRPDDLQVRADRLDDRALADWLTRPS